MAWTEPTNYMKIAKYIMISPHVEAVDYDLAYYDTAEETLRELMNEMWIEEDYDYKWRVEIWIVPETQKTECDDNGIVTGVLYDTAETTDREWLEREC